MEHYSGAEAFVEVLNANRVEHIFFNPGADTAPVQAAIMKYRSLGKRAPKLVLCLHESVALTAAHGHYMVSGRPQVVMVHSELGTQQLGGALHNAQWGRVPVIIWAGLAAAPQRTNWKKEPYDQGGIVRNSVKWDYEVKSTENIHDVLQQAFNNAFTEPRGPVYLSYPRDILAREIEKLTLEAPEYPRPEFPPLDAQSLTRIADILIEARNPIILAGYTSRYPESVDSLVALAETLGTPVISGVTRLNFPTTHPLSAGIEKMGSAARGNVLAEADVVLVIDYDSPYVPGPGVPGKEARIIHIDVDPLTQGRPLWGRTADIYLMADSRQAMPALAEIVRQKLTPEKRAQIRERSIHLKEKHEQEREERHTLGASKSAQMPISPDWVCRCVAQVIDEDTILVNHLISHGTSVAEQIDRTRPGTLLSCAGGSIQWALGAALGAKVARPESTVVSLMTDGGFVWGCPVATLWSARSYQAPFLSVIFNNQSYGAIRRIVERLSETKLPDEMAFTAGVDISPPADYALVAQSCGGYGRMVEDPADVLPALKEAMNEVRNGRLAVVDVRLEKG